MYAQNRHSIPRLTCAATATALAGSLTASTALAQVLDNEARRTVTLEDGLQVTLIGAATDGDEPLEWYALPNQLLNATNADGEPQFLFMAFTTNDRPEDGGAAGGLLHALVTWGFTPEQEEELRTAVSGFGAGAEYGGFVQMMPPDGESASFALVSAVLGDEGFASNVVTSGEAPLIAGGKAAVAARLDPAGAQALFKTFEGDSTAGDLSVTMNFAYVTQVQGPQGTINIDWQRIEETSESLERTYNEEHDWEEDRDRCWLFFRCDAHTVTYSYEEIHSQFEFLREQELLTFEFEEGFPSERAAPLRDAFIQYFVNLIGEPTAPPRSEPDEEESEGSLPEGRTGTHYEVTRERTEEFRRSKSETLNMDYRFQIKWPHQVTGNIKNWGQAAQDFEHKYQKVILDDPFFQWRDIVAVVDVSAKELFEDQANFVTVQLEKPRADGTWNESITIDQQYIEENGVRATRTYARGGEERGGDSYRWRQKWSFRGGETWPEDPEWHEGGWEGFTLSAPLEPRTIDFDANLGELKASGIVRVAAQVRYRKLGEEEQANIPISVPAGDASVSKRIYMDSDAPGYVYRLVINHRRLPVMATEWSGRTGNDYIYARIPEEILVAESAEDDAVVDATEAAQDDGEGELAEFEETLQ